ncbi:hypothetical protein P4305_18695 [Bacillus thuringiensis]|nr:hypothetical protein [Bacillus thuringiensis]
MLAKFDKAIEKLNREISYCDDVGTFTDEEDYYIISVWEEGGKLHISASLFEDCTELAKAEYKTPTGALNFAKRYL